jgi:K+-sensing histidine kinase KdpD
LNAQLLQRTLHNLIDNALEYGSAPIRLSAHAQQERLVIQVEDHGPGLSSYDQLPLPYQPQSHDRGHTQHSGLGLAIAERFCRDNGGSLHLAPSALGGLQVQLRLPASVLISAPP